MGGASFVALTETGLRMLVAADAKSATVGLRPKVSPIVASEAGQSRETETVGLSVIKSVQVSLFSHKFAHFRGLSRASRPSCSESIPAR